MFKWLYVVHKDWGTIAGNVWEGMCYWGLTMAEHMRGICINT